MSETIHRGTRLALASLLAVALTAQLLIGLSADLTVTNFFSYFTVLSNVGAAIVLFLLAARPGRDDARWFATVRGAVTVYMAVTGLVYATILYPQLADVAAPEPWIDMSIHVIGPIAVAADWLYDPPEVPLPAITVVYWLIFPAVYLAYSLIRGAIVDWYPYPFLDPEQSGGYGVVAIWSAIVLVVIVGFGYLFQWWARRRTPEAAT